MKAVERVGPLTPARPRAASLLLPLQGLQAADPPRAHGSGPAPYRVLAGGELFAGYGVLTHDLGLAGGLARDLAGRTGHGVDVDVVPGTARAFLSSAITARLTHVDAVVLQVDRSVLRHAGPEASGLREQLSALRRRLGRHAAVVLVADSTDLEISRITDHELEAAIQPSARLVVLAPAPGTARELYVEWGGIIAAVLADELRYPQLWVDPVDALDESAREQSVAALGPLDDQWEAAFHRIAHLARAAYGTKFASVSVVGKDTTTYTGGATPSDLRAEHRSDSICGDVLRTYGGVLVSDARSDPRYAALPSVVAGRTRFYAGYRVRAPDGQPVAALCVFDDEPRDAAGVDLAPLRDFAIAAERQLWGLVTRRAAEPDGTGPRDAGQLDGWI